MGFKSDTIDYVAASMGSAQAGFVQARSGNRLLPRSPTTYESLRAIFQQENVVSNVLQAMDAPQYEADPDYFLTDAEIPPDLMAYREQLEGSQSAYETMYRIGKIRAELENRRIIADTPGGLALFGNIAAGILSPESLLPIGAGLAAARTGLKGGKAVLAAMGAGALTASAEQTLAETQLQQLQFTRTDEESYFNVAGAAVLGGLLGGAGGLVAQGRRKVLEDLTSTTMKIRKADQDFIAQLEADGLSVEDVRRISDDEWRTRVQAYLVEKHPELAVMVGDSRKEGTFVRRWYRHLLGRTPVLRSAMSDSVVLRITNRELTQTALVRKGLPDELHRPSVEIEAAVWNARGMQTVSEMTDDYKAYRKAWKENPPSTSRSPLTEQEYFDHVTRATRRVEVDAEGNPTNVWNPRGQDDLAGMRVDIGDTVTIDALAKSVARYRAWNDAVKVLGNEHSGHLTLSRLYQNSVDRTANSYVPRVYNPEKTSRNEDDFNWVISRGLEDLHKDDPDFVLNPDMVAAARNHIERTFDGSPREAGSSNMFEGRNIEIRDDYTTITPDGRRIGLEDFLENDARVLIGRQTHRVLPLMVLARRMGGPAYGRMLDLLPRWEKAVRLLHDAPDADATRRALVELDRVRSEINDAATLEVMHGQLDDEFERLARDYEQVAKARERARDDVTTMTERVEEEQRQFRAINDYVRRRTELEQQIGAIVEDDAEILIAIRSEVERADISLKRPRPEQAKVRDLEGRRDEAVRRIQELRARVQAAQEEAFPQIEGLEQELAQQSSTLEKIRQEIDEVVLAGEDLGAPANRARVDRMTELERDVETRTADLERLRTERDQAAADRTIQAPEAMRRELAQQEETLAEIEAELARDPDVARVEAKVQEDSYPELPGLERQLEQQQATLTAIRAEIDEVTLSGGDLGSPANQARVDRMTALEEEVAFLEGEVARQRTELTQAVTEQVDSATARRVQRAEALRQDIERRRAEIEAATIQGGGPRTERIADEIDRLEVEAQALENAIADIKGRGGQLNIEAEVQRVWDHALRAERIQGVLAPAYKKAREIIAARDELRPLAKRYQETHAGRALPELEGIADGIGQKLNTAREGLEEAKFRWGVESDNARQLREYLQQNVRRELMQDVQVVEPKPFADTGEEAMAQYAAELGEEVARIRGRMAERAQSLTWRAVAIDKEYIAEINKYGPDHPERARLNRRRQDALKDLEGMRQQLTGVVPQTDEKLGVQITSGLRKINYITKMGGMMISSIPDIAMGILTQGFIPWAKMAARFFADPRLKNASKDEIAQLLIAAEMSMGSMRMARIGGIEDLYGLKQGVLDRGTVLMTKLSLMDRWNAANKAFASVAITQKSIDVFGKVARGERLTGPEEQYLQLSGISEDMAQRIHQQIGVHGNSERVYGIKVTYSNSRNWTDVVAKDYFEQAVMQNVHRTIITPGIGELPLFAHTNMGRVILQFKSFSFAASQNVLISGAQRFFTTWDRNVAGGVTALFGMGLMTEWLKRMLNVGPDYAAELYENPSLWAVNGIDRSGLLGIFADLNAIAERMTMGKLGLSALTPEGGVSRYSSRNLASAILGPSFGQASAIAQAAQFPFKMAEGDLGRTDVTNLRRMLPFQNLWYLKAMIDSIGPKVLTGESKQVQNWLVTDEDLERANDAWSKLWQEPTLP